MEQGGHVQKKYIGTNTQLTVLYAESLKLMPPSSLQRQQQVQGFRPSQGSHLNRKATDRGQLLHTPRLSAIPYPGTRTFRLSRSQELLALVKFRFLPFDQTAVLTGRATSLSFSVTLKLLFNLKTAAHIHSTSRTCRIPLLPTAQEQHTDT